MYGLSESEMDRCWEAWAKELNPNYQMDCFTAFDFVRVTLNRGFDSHMTALPAEMIPLVAEARYDLFTPEQGRIFNTALKLEEDRFEAHFGSLASERLREFASRQPL